MASKPHSERIRQTLAFMESTIKSGEGYTETVVLETSEALAALDSLIEQLERTQGAARRNALQRDELKEQLGTLREAWKWQQAWGDSQLDSFLLQYETKMRNRAGLYPASEPEPELEHDPATGWRKGHEGVWSFRGGEWNRLDVPNQDKEHS